jgi:hypothetical protein
LRRSSGEPYMAEGHKEVTWTAEDYRGKAVSSGVNFYRLVAGDFERTREMVLLKQYIRSHSSLDNQTQKDYAFIHDEERDFRNKNLNLQVAREPFVDQCASKKKE